MFVSSVLLTLVIGALNPAGAPAQDLAVLPDGPRYVVVFQPSSEDPAIRAAALATLTGAEVVRVFRHAIQGCVLSGLDPREARRVARDPAVRSVEVDRPVSLRDVQAAPPWGLDRVDQRDLPLDLVFEYDATGVGVRIYILDTGIRISHQEFGGRASHGWDFIDNDPVAEDGQGHGTHVAATAAGGTYGVAKGAEVIGVRVLDNNGSGSVSGVIAGVDWVTANAVKPAVANMSLGGGPSPALDAAVEASIASGITYCIAAGNGGVIGVIGIPVIGTPDDACLTSPARVTEALTIGATDINDAEAAFSNFGACVDLLAPGVNVASAAHTSDSGTSTKSGTSMAAPHVAGAVALYLETHSGASPLDVELAIKSNATRDRITAMKSALTPNLLLYTGPVQTPVQATTWGRIKAKY